MRLWPTSVRARLTLWYGVVLCIPLVAFAVGSYAVLQRTLEHRTDAFLTETRDAFVAELFAEREENATVADAIDAALRDFHLRDVRIAVYDRAGRLLGTSRPPAQSSTPADDATITRGLARLGVLVADPHPDPDRAIVLPDDEGGTLAHVRRIQVDEVLLTVAAVQSRHRDREVLEALRSTYLLAVPLILVVASVSGWFLARRSLSPIVAMSRRANEIGAARLHERLPVHDPRDELGALAVVVNGLLERLERSFDQQRRFMADASHELRTPVAIVRAEVDVALARAHRSEAEYRDALAVVRDGARRLGRIVDDIFLLARADAGREPVRHEPLYLDELVTEGARAVRALAEQRDVRIDVRPLPDAPFVGDAELLGRLLLNLLDNAIKYSPPCATVTVALACEPDAYTLSVRDAGPGIPAEAQPHVFERFFRVEQARSRTEASETSGAGLGLAIARWIAEAHGGRLTLTHSDATGSEFRLTLPHSTPR